MTDQAKELQERAQWSAKLQKLLKLDGSPVAVAILTEMPDGLKQWEGLSLPCIMLQSARRGDAFYGTEDNMKCMGGRYIGLPPPKPFPDSEGYLTSKKLYASWGRANRHYKWCMSLAPSGGSGKYAAFAPLEKASFTPDVVVFVGIAVQIYRIIFLDEFETGLGGSDIVHGSPTCLATIGAPISTGKFGLSLCDAGSRQEAKFKNEELAVGVPYERLSTIVNSIDRCILGTAEPEQEGINKAIGQEWIITREGLD